MDKLLSQINKLDKNLYDKGVIAQFLERTKDGLLTRDENDKTHFCVYFLAYDPQAQEVFVGHHKKSGLWLFTGGHIDKGETLEQAVAREVWEEWGQKMLVSNVGKPSLLTITEINNPAKQTCKIHYDVWYFFKVDKNNFEVDNEKLAKEFHEIGWKKYDEAKNLITDPSTLKALGTIANKVIGFALDLVPLIKNGTKTLTYRVGDKYDYLKVGDKILFKNSENDKVVGELEIIEKSWTIFKDLPTDKQGHEIYPSKQIQRDTFKKYYKQDIEDSEPILILGFKLLKILKSKTSYQS